MNELLESYNDYVNTKSKKSYLTEFEVDKYYLMVMVFISVPTTILQNFLYFVQSYIHKKIGMREIFILQLLTKVRNT